MGGKLREEMKTPLLRKGKQESTANAKGTRDTSAYVKAHCEQM